MGKRNTKPKTAERLSAFEKKKGFKGVFKGPNIRRKCAKCDQPTTALAESCCPKHGGKGWVPKFCQAIGCKKQATRAKGTQCTGCWVKADPEARGCPGCQTLPKSKSRADEMCRDCVRKAAVEAKRDEGRVLLAQLCADEDITEGPPRPTATTLFGKRYAVLNPMDDHKPRVRVRSGDEWKPACAERGCPHVAICAPGTPNTHCKVHGGGHRCPGGPDATAGCPLGNGIHVNESDDHVRYLKDGIQYCCACFCDAFKDHELARNAKRRVHAKEQNVREFLERRFATSHPLLKWVMDRQVEGTRRRPDHRPLLHLLGIKSHDLVIESDENSHWFYLCADERDKEKTIHYYINGEKKPLCFIRFNVDAYDDLVTGTRVTSCWGVGKDGIVRIKKGRDAEWAARLEKLAQMVEMYLVDYTDTWAAWAEADRPKAELHTIELFYDNVAVKKNEAAQAFAAIKAASEAKKKAATTATAAASDSE